MADIKQKTKRKIKETEWKKIEDIKDYAVGKYWDFIKDIEFNGKSPNYFGETSDRIAKELYDFFYKLIADEKRIRYDFTTKDESEAYRDKMLEKVLNPDYKKALNPDYLIVSLFNTVMVFSALSDITTQPISVLFDTPCKFENSDGIIKIALNSFANDVTTGFPSVNTINLLVISNADEVISMFPVDSDLIENEIRNLFEKYMGDKNIKKLYKELRGNLTWLWKPASSGSFTTPEELLEAVQNLQLWCVKIVTLSIDR